jgi:antitoxin component YwqK of YwqJK toxin-antitoxin module
MNKKLEKQTSHSPPDSFPNFKTSDLYLSSYIKSKGMVLKNIEREGKRVSFIFADNGKLKDTISDYYNGGEVNALTYKANLSELRSLIFNPEIQKLNGDDNERKKINAC